MIQWLVLASQAAPRDGADDVSVSTKQRVLPAVAFFRCFVLALND